MEGGILRRPWLGLLPLVIFYIMIFVIPFAILIRVSFTQGVTYFFEPVYTLENYTNLFTRYGPTIRNSFSFTLIAAVIDFIFGYPLAYILVRKEFPFKNVVRALMVFPFFGGLYIAFGLSYLFLPGGPLSFVFEWFHIPFYKLLYSSYSVILGFAIFTSPFMILYTGVSLQEIDPSLEEAARSLGASPLRTFLKVTFPLSLPGAFTGLLVCFGWNMGGYIIPLLLGGPTTSDVITVNMVQLAMTGAQQYGQAAALGVFLLLSIGTIFFTAMRITGKEVI